MLTKLTTK